MIVTRSRKGFPVLLTQYVVSCSQRCLSSGPKAPAPFSPLYHKPSNPRSARPALGNGRSTPRCESSSSYIDDECTAERQQQREEVRGPLGPVTNSKCAKPAFNQERLSLIMVFMWSKPGAGHCASAKRFCQTIPAGVASTSNWLADRGRWSSSGRRPGCKGRAGLSDIVRSSCRCLSSCLLLQQMKSCCMTKSVRQAD